MKSWWLAVLVLAGCISPVMHFGGGKSAPQAQHDTLTEFMPSRLALDKRWTGSIANATVRVYADDEYRAQNRRWREAFDDRLDYVNAVLGASFGVRLVADYREWNHHAPGASLAEHLAQLQQLDAGDGALTVIGLTSSLSLAAATFEQLGYASISGKHMMLRGYADLEERKSFTAAFPDLSADELEAGFETMRSHKNAAVFLHELGHNLGAEHDPAPDTLMSASYSRNAKSFSPEAATTIQRTLDERLGRAHPEDPRTAAPADPAGPAAHPKVHLKMHVTVLASGAIVDGVTHEDDELNILFSMQASIDSEVQVIVNKQAGVPSATVAGVLARLQAQGLKNVTLE